MSAQPLQSRSSEPGVKSGLALNLFPAILTSTTVSVWVGLYPTPESVRELESRIPGLVTWRDPDDNSRLYIWHPVQSFAVPDGFNPVTVRLEESPRLFERLVEDAVYARLAGIGFTAKSEGWVNYGKKSLLAEVPALASAVTESIGIYPKIIAEVFFTKTADDSLLLGLVVDVLYTTRMDVTAAEWVKAGLSDQLRGLYVALVPGSAEAGRFPDYAGRVVGRVDAIRGDRCVLADVRDSDLSTVMLTGVAPEPTRSNLGVYLTARYEKAYADGEQTLMRKLRELVRPRNRHKLATGLVLTRLQPRDSPYVDEDLPILPGVRVRFGEMVRTSIDQFPVRKLSGPEYWASPDFVDTGFTLQLRVLS